MSGRLTWLGLLLGLLCAATARADDPAAEIRDVSVELHEGVYYLDADIDYQLGEEHQQALRNGVPLVFELQIGIDQLRDWWPDREVAVLSQRQQVRYHALSRRYVLTNLNTGYSRSYADEHSLLLALGRVDSLPLIDQRLLDQGKPYELQLRARLDPQALPLPLRTLALVSPDWRLASEWYLWHFEA